MKLEPIRLSRLHVPEWLEKNWLFRELFVRYKLLNLRRTRHAYYGLPYERAFLRGKFPRDYRGFFVDVGCFHPFKLNNTYWFYKNGWRGINIDMDAIKIHAFNRARPHDTNVHAAVSERAGELRYFSKGIWSATTTLEASTISAHETVTERRVHADTLTHLIDATKYRSQRIDFLSVDAEGHDLAVLRSLDFARYQPRYIAVETWHTDFDSVAASELYQFLVQQNYALINWLELNLLFQHRETKAFDARPSR